MDLILVFIMCIIGFYPMYLEFKSGEFDLFNIKNAFILYFIIQLGFSGLISINSKYPSEIGISHTTYSFYYTKAFLFSLIGLSFFQVGYYFTSKNTIKINNKIGFIWKSKQVHGIIYFFLFLGIFAFLLFLKSNGGIDNFLANREEFRTSGISGQGFLIYPATHILNLSAIIYAIYSFRKDSNKQVFISLILLFISMLPAFLMGFRGLIILPFLEFLVILNYNFKRISFKKILPIGSIVISLFTVYGIVRELPRNVNINYDIVRDLVIKNPEILYSVVSRSKGTEVLASELKNLDETNNFDYGYKSFIEALTIFIPGKLWDGKPQPSSVRYTTYFFGDDLAFSRGIKQDSWGGISPTIIGEFYWHFGLFGVIIGMFFFGFLFSKIYRTFIRNKNKQFVLFIYAESFPMLIMMAEAVQGYFNTLVLYFFTWYLLFILLRIVLIKNKIQTNY
jgi:oligosaccharide repeat unit polymerase